MNNSSNELNSFEKWVVKKRSIWFHIIVGYLSCFIWLIIYFYCKYKSDKINKVKEEKMIIDKKDNTDEKRESFECEIIMDCHKSEIHRFINTCIRFELIDKNDLYEGYSDNEIENIGTKVYKCINCYLPCEIIANYDNEHYEIKYTEHSNDYYFGYIPIEYNEKISDIINNKSITFGGIMLENGLYKEYDYNKNEIIEGYDEYKIKLHINYN